MRAAVGSFFFSDLTNDSCLHPHLWACLSCSQCFQKLTFGVTSPLQACYYFLMANALPLKRQQDHAWGALSKLRKQKSARCQHTKSKRSQTVTSRQQPALLVTAHCAKIVFCKSSLISFISLGPQRSPGGSWCCSLSAWTAVLSPSSYSKVTLGS